MFVMNRVCVAGSSPTARIFWRESNLLRCSPFEQLFEE